MKFTCRANWQHSNGTNRDRSMAAGPDKGRFFASAFCRLIMSITIYKSRLIDNMIGNRSQVPVFIIRSFGTPHGKSDLDPGIGKTPECMIRAFALVTFFDKLLFSPGT